MTDSICVHYSIARLTAREWHEWSAGRKRGDDDDEEDAGGAAPAAPAPAAAGAGAGAGAGAAGGAAAAPVVILSTGEVIPVITGGGGSLKTGAIIADAVNRRLFADAGAAGAAGAPADPASAQAAWLAAAVTAHHGLIRGTARQPVLPDAPSLRAPHAVVIATEREVVAGAAVTLTLTRGGIRFPPAPPTADGPGRTVRAVLAARDPARLVAAAAAAGGAVALTIDGAAVSAALGADFFAGPEEAVAAAGPVGDATRAALAADVGAAPAAALVASIAKFLA
jgi:hypothetical protein